MRYLVTTQNLLFESPFYEVISVEQSMEILCKLKIIGIDTETTGLEVHTKLLKSVQMGNKENQIFIDTSTIDITLYKDLIEADDKLFLFWNAKFDLKFLYHKGIVPKHVWDGFLAEKMLWQGYPAGEHSMSLKSAAWNYLEVTMDKSVRGRIIYQPLNSEIIVYGCTDVEHLESIKDLQDIQLNAKELQAALCIENEFVKVLAYIEYCGIRLDVARWKAKMAKDLEKQQEAETSLNAWVVDYYNTFRGNAPKIFNKFIKVDKQGDLFSGFNPEPQCIINWNSSKQVIPLLESLGFNLLTKDKKTGLMKKSVDAKVIELQKDKSTITPVYSAYKGAQKVVSTYGQTVIDAINPVTGRIHTNFNQLMDTGRLSCGGKDKEHKVDYVNLQNLPSDHETRHSFIPNEGYMMIDCDYTAQEDFVFTELSQEPKLIEFYNDTKRKRDGHSFVAKICFPIDLAEIPEEEVKNKRPDLRGLAKKAKFSIHYGGNGDTIARNLSLPLKQGHDIEKSYLSGFSNIDAYFKHVKTDMWEKGYILISALTGHKMFIPGWEELKAEEASYTREFWEAYRPIKQAWIEAGEDRDNRPPLMMRVSKFFKTKSGFERNSLNAPVQGTAAIITKIAGVRYFNHLVESNLLFKVLIPNCVHDEYLIEPPLELLEQETKEIQKAMDEAAAFFCKSVKLVAVPEVADYWIH